MLNIEDYYTQDEGEITFLDFLNKKEEK